MKKLFLLLLFSSVMLSGFAAKANKKTVPENLPSALSAAEQRKLDYFFYEALRQRHLGNYDRTIDLLTECFFIDPQNAAVAYEFATIYSYIQDMPHALSFVQLAIRLNPANLTYKKSYAEYLIRNGNLKDAALVYEDIIKTDENEEMDFMLASLYRQTGELKKSIAALDRFEHRFGINENVSLEKFNLYLAQNRNRQAYREIDRLMERFPQESRYKILRATLYLDEEKTEKAFQLLDEVKESDAGNEMLIAALYGYYKTNNDTTQINKLFIDLFENKTLGAEEKMGALAWFLMQENQSAVQAEQFFNILMAQYPANEFLLTCYANFLLMQRRYDEADRVLESLLAVNPLNREVWQDLMAVYLQFENWDALISAAERAISFFPNEFKFYFFHSLAFVRTERYDEALQTLEKGLKLVSETDLQTLSDFNTYIADLYVEKKDTAKAFEHYEKAYSQNAENVALLNNFAYNLAVTKKDLDRAETMSATAVAAQPDNISYLDTYAWVFFRKGNLVLAQLYIRQAIDKGGDANDVISEHYGDILYGLGEKKEAVRWWKKSLELGNKSSVLPKKVETGTYIE